MKRVLLFLIFFMIVPATMADISLTTEQSVYNLGNKVKASASILQSNDVEGLFSLTLACGNYRLQYFLTPISLESGFRTAVDVPDLPVTQSMLGDCKLITYLTTNDDILIEEKTSETFTLTDQLNVLPVRNHVTSFPADIIQIVGVVNEASGMNVLSASAKIVLDNNSYSVDATDGKFNLTLQLPRNIKSKIHIIEISASDSKGNFGLSSIELEIIPVPSYLKTFLSGSSFDPGSKVEITASLYDQADELINTSLDLELASPSKNKVFRKLVQSNEEIDYEFSQYSEPGAYLLVTSYKNLLNNMLINLTTVREVKVRYENETVLVENVGNVIFEDELTFVLESGEQKYPVARKVKVDPGKIISLDLSREVPLGIYNILLSVKDGISPVTDRFNVSIKDIAESAQQSFSNLLQGNEIELAGDVTIHDNRPLHKKLASGFSSLSAFLVGADGLLARNPVIAPLIVVTILLLIIFRYGKGPITRMMRKKEDEDRKDKS